MDIFYWELVLINQVFARTLTSFGFRCRIIKSHLSGPFKFQISTFKFQAMDISPLVESGYYFNKKYWYKMSNVYPSSISCLTGVTSNKAFPSSLLHAIIACIHRPFFKICSNFVYFWQNFHIFCLFYPF